MAHRMGKALLTALHAEASEPEVREAEPVLLHPRRARLFRFYCLHPGSVTGDAADATGMAPGTVRWHGSRLVDADWLSPHASSYYPRGLVDPDDLPVFDALNTTGRRRFLGLVFGAPGQSLSDLGRGAGVTRHAAARLVDDLASVGLASVIEDGAFARVYPSPTLERRREANRERARAFCDAVVRRLATAGLDPEVLRRTASNLLLRAGPPGRRVALDVPIDPFAAALLE